ncbi:hypothetical protein ONZ45_g3421 [Pleurotus djamor]|nr:hypothetical protein ONZ45_g3421 [Pleurotus djamor]
MNPPSTEETLPPALTAYLQEISLSGIRDAPSFSSLVLSAQMVLHIRELLLSASAQDRHSFRILVFKTGDMLRTVSEELCGVLGGGMASVDALQCFRRDLDELFSIIMQTYALVQDHASTGFFGRLLGSHTRHEAIFWQQEVLESFKSRFESNRRDGHRPHAPTTVTTANGMTVTSPSYNLVANLGTGTVNTVYGEQNNGVTHKHYYFNHGTGIFTSPLVSKVDIPESSAITPPNYDA